MTGHVIRYTTPTLSPAAAQSGCANNERPTPIENSCPAEYRKQQRAMDPKNASHIKLGSESSKACWECIRRSIDCDGSRPVCKKCLESGIVCPGFHNKKPLVWVTPGKVTHRAPQRPRRKKGILTDDASKSKASIATTLVRETRENPETATALVIRSHASKQALTPASSSCSDHSSVTSPKTGQYTTASYEFVDIDWGTDSTEGSKELSKQNRRSPSSTESFSPELYKALQLANTVPASLLVGDYELVGALDYYISQIYMPIAEKLVVQSLHIPPTTSVSELLPGIQSPCRRHALMALIWGHHIFVTSGKQRHGAIHMESGDTSQARTRFYHHLGRALKELKMELSSKEGPPDLGIFRTILLLLTTEVSQCVYQGTLAHLNGFLALTELRGGLRKLLSQRGRHWAGLQVFMITCVLTYATSPSNHQLVKASQMDMDDLYSLYTWSVMPGMVCSPHLFLDMVRINRLRFEAANIPFVMAPGNLGQSAFQEILDDIWGFSPELWAQSTGFPHENQVVLVGRVFQYSMAFYAFKSLQDGAGTDHLFREVNAGGFLPKHQAHHLYFEMVELAMESLYIDSMGWPLTVAGAIAETPSERAAVKRNLGKLTNYIGFSAPLQSLTNIFEEFWASGKSAWDECFHRVHIFI